MEIISNCLQSFVSHNQYLIIIRQRLSPQHSLSFLPPLMKRVTLVKPKFCNKMTLLICGSASHLVSSFIQHYRSSSTPRSDSTSPRFVQMVLASLRVTTFKEPDENNYFSIIIQVIIRATAFVLLVSSLETSRNLAVAI